MTQESTNEESQEVYNDPPEENPSQEEETKEGESSDEEGESQSDEEESSEEGGNTDDEEPDGDSEDVDDDADGESTEGDKELKLEVSDNSLLSKDEVKGLESFAKDNNLSKEQATKLLEREEKQRRDFFESQKPYGEGWKKRVGEWEKEVKSDKDFAKTPKVLKENIHYASKWAKNNLSKEVRQFLDESGLGSNIHLLRDLAKLGKKNAPDKVVHGKTKGVVKQQSEGDLIFGPGTEVRTANSVPKGDN